VAPATGGPSHLLTDITVWDDKPQWSADGRLLYFLSSRGGRFALWALGFDPNRGLANGVPFLVTQFATGPRAVDLYDNDTALSDLSVVGSKVVLTLQLRSGGIWLLE
jgi:hypothetical protein